jgi:hypothetical protein
MCESRECEVRGAMAMGRMALRLAARRHGGICDDTVGYGMSWAMGYGRGGLATCHMPPHGTWSPTATASRI